MKPEAPRNRRFFFAGKRVVVFADDLPAGFAALLLYFVENMVYCICNLHLAI